ncbi:MAG: DUF4062 domain-containing protein [Proteobacteria bacterium]|nr:DUF4062 domain-containing protein [Pseudomonadota bacterium]
MPQASRTFRIFVSSTFGDLKEERNALQKRVFPKLRELCIQHGCRFQAIDLRWGVREEAALDQQTIKICMEEISRCQKTSPRPNFIVLLGDRYGWQPLPEEIPKGEFEQITAVIETHKRTFDNIATEATGLDALTLLDKWYKSDDNAVPPLYILQPREGKFEDYNVWEKEVESPLRYIFRKVTKDLSLSKDERLKYETSTTHQEIEHGTMVEDARKDVFGFFRRITNLDDLIACLPTIPARDFIDTDTQGNFDGSAQNKLLAIKTSLGKKIGEDNIHKYNTRWTKNGITTDHIDKVCEDVYKSLSRIILEEIAQFEEVDPLEKEIADHETFGEDRTRFFTGRTVILQTIADYIKGDDRHPLAVFGASGSGKTALMAKVVEQVQKEYKDAEVIFRFIGATPNSSDGLALLESLCRQISRQYGADESTLPTDYRELVQEFQKWLAVTTKEKPLIMFLDAIDQLSDANYTRNLLWLPAKLPEHVHLIVSTSPGECLSVLEHKLPEVNRIELEFMPLNEGSDLLALWLKDAKRTLQTHQRKEVLDKFASCGLPLYLKLAFEETRRWKSYREETTLSPDIPSIIRDLFDRLSSDAHHGKIMVSHSLGYLATARRGLTEEELLDVLSQDKDVLNDFKSRAKHTPPEEHLPVVIWSRLYFDLEPYLTERAADGTILMTFYHRQVGEVVAEEFLAGEAKRKRHEELARYFSRQSLWIEKDEKKNPNIRKVSELPWQWSKAEEWEQLKSVLTDVPFLNAAWGMGGHEIMTYWANITARLNCRTDKAYADQWEGALRAGEDLLFLGGLLLTQGYPEEAERIFTAQAEWCEQHGEKLKQANALQGRAEIVRNRGDGVMARKFLERSAEIYQKLDDEKRLANCLGSLATLMADYDHNLHGALELFQKQEAIYRSLHDDVSLQGCIGNQANIHILLGNLKVALILREQGEHLSEELGISIELQKHRMSRAVILNKQGHWQESLQLLEGVEGECRRMNLEDTLAACLGQQANVLATRNRHVEAAWKNRKAEKHYRRVKNWFGLTQCLFNQALHAMKMCRVCQEEMGCWLDWRTYGETKAKVALKYMKQVGSTTYPTETQALCKKLLADFRLQPLCRVVPSTMLIQWDWSQLKSMSLKSLRRIEWQLLNPLSPTPGRLIWDRFLDKLALGRVSRKMMNGYGVGMQTADQWFRWAARAILIRPTLQDAYFRRAINGTLNKGPNRGSLYSQAYMGFNESGQEVEYDIMYGIVDTEILLRMNPSHSAARLLQGILIFQVISRAENVDAEQGFTLTKDLITQSLSKGEIPEGLRSKGKEYLEHIETWPRFMR